MSKHHRAAIYFTFSLGVVPALTCLVRFVTLNTDETQPNLVYILSMVEMATAIAAVAVPGLKPLLDRRGIAGERAGSDQLFEEQEVVVADKAAGDQV